MAPDEREFGILIGKVEAIGEQLSEMRRTNSIEHANVITKLDEVRAEVATKASETWVKELDERTDSLEATRDKGSGGAAVIRIGQGVAVLVLASLPWIVQGATP